MFLLFAADRDFEAISEQFTGMIPHTHTPQTE